MNKQTQHYDIVIVGAHFTDDAGINSGAAYVFPRDWGGLNNWGEAAKLAAARRVKNTL